MWCQKAKNGKWRYFENYKDPKTGKKRIASITLDGSSRAYKKAAEKALDARITALCADAAISSDVTFKRLCEDYTAAQRRSVKAQTVISNERKNDVLRKLIGDDVLVSKLTAPYVRKALEAEKATTYNERLKRYKALMRWAYREDYVKDVAYLDKLQNMKTPPPRETNKHKYLEKDEIATLLNGMKVETWNLLARFMILSGCRIGEVIALTDADFNLFDREIYVNKTYSLELKKDSTTKTDMSCRTVYMQDELFRCCMDIVAHKKEHVENFGPTDLLFPDLNGKHLHYEAFNKYLKEKSKKLIGRPLTSHALRHTHVAMLAEAGVPLDTISRRCGHADSKVTKEIYMHVTKKMVEADNELLRKVKIV